jgi:hypothetical protein
MSSYDNQIVEPDEASRRAARAGEGVARPKEHTLAGLFGRREVDLVERNQRAVKERLPVETPQPAGAASQLSDGVVEGGGLIPFVGRVVAQPPPFVVATERASYCEYRITILGGRGIARLAGGGPSRGAE